jgi:two-component sensor histidine kinase
MDGGEAPTQSHDPSQPEAQNLASRALSLDELQRLYEAERAARSVAEQRFEALLRERQSAQQTTDVRDYVMAGAHCMLWYAEIYETNAPYLHWQMEFPNVEAARRFLPIEIRAGETLKDAWYGRRHPDDRAICDRIGTNAVRAGKSYQQEFRCYCEDGTLRWLYEDVRVETIVEAKQWRAVGVCTDTTAHHQMQARMQATNKRLKRSIAETHHRVKNNLQVVAALADMHDGDSPPAEAQNALRRLGQHIRALAAMHDLLTAEAYAGSDNDSVAVRAVLERLVALARETMRDRKIRVHVQDVRLPSRQVTALVVLVNELLSNAGKHAHGEIGVTLDVHSGLVHLEVCDGGPGFPPGFDARSFAKTGLEIVDSIGRLDLQGTLRYYTHRDGGARVSVEFQPTAAIVM